jgi:hypothetical protein
MRELGPARVYVAERLGDGDYAKGTIMLEAKLAEARAAWVKLDKGRSLAALAVVLCGASLLLAQMVLLGRPLLIWVAVIVPFLALLFISILCSACMEGYVRFGRAPHGLAWLAPKWLDRWMVARLAIVRPNDEGVFAGFAARQLIATVGNVEIDPRLFADRLWPLLLSSDDRERRRAAWREYGYRGEDIAFHEISLIEDEIPVSQESLPLPEVGHPFQQVPYDLKAAWIAEAVKRKGYVAGSYRHELLKAVLAAGWDEINAPEWHARKLNNAEIARRCHDRVVSSGKGFHSTELTEGKVSKEPADWIQKMISGRSAEYRFAVEAAVAMTEERT